MFRKMVRDDLPQLFAIEQSSQGAPWTEETFKACFEMECDGWVVEHEGRIAGYIVLSLKPEECHILNLCVARAFQRQGLGRKLLEFGLDEAKKRKMGIAYLEVRRSNSRAIALYRKMKFLMIGERKNYYQTVNGPEDALIFAMSLTNDNGYQPIK
jgi:ribosomal-protein-alanine N-acetyltransferase